MPNEDIPDLDVDQILADAKEPVEARQVEGGDEPPVKTEEAPAWWAQEFEVGGKKYKADTEEKAKLWLQGGVNYSQRAGELNAKERLWAKEREELLGYKEKFTGYSQVDAFAAKNPEWWQHVQSSWQTREVPKGVDPGVTQLLTPLQEKLSKVESFIGSLEAEKQEQRVKEDNDALDKEITSIREQHPTIDFSAKDETGETLERRILKHAMDHNTPSFRMAFRDYLHKELVEGAKATGKEALVKTTQLNAKKGILGTSQASTRELKAVNTRLPWNDPSLKGDAILKEMGLA